MDLVAVAKNYVSKGLSVISLDDFKRPTVEWMSFMKRVMTDKEVELNFKSAKGIGVICGSISGNLEVIDWDLKYALNAEMYPEALSRVPKTLLDKLVIVGTRNAGYHWMYRCITIEGNQKLAQRPTTESEKAINIHDKIRVLAETRGEKGFVCSIGTEGYKLVTGNKICEITPEERHLLLDICRSYNEVFNEAELFEKSNVERTKKFLKSPFDDYNERESALTVLQNNGWSVVGKQHGDKVRVARPGITSSEHSGFYNYSSNKVSVFSTSTILDANKSYSPCELFCILQNGGDWKKTYSELLSLGYGQAIDLTYEVNAFIGKLKGNRLIDNVRAQFGGDIISPTKIKIEGKTYEL